MRRGRRLEVITLGRNVVGIAVLAVAAIRAGSVALAAFGLDSLIEIGASTVVLWELSGTGEDRQRRALRLIGAAFIALALYLSVQSTLALATGLPPSPQLARDRLDRCDGGSHVQPRRRQGTDRRDLDNQVLLSEGRVPRIDALLALAVLAVLVRNAAAGLCWADPTAGCILVYYGAKEARAIFSDTHCPPTKPLARLR